MPYFLVADQIHHHHSRQPRWVQISGLKEMREEAKMTSTKMGENRKRFRRKQFAHVAASFSPVLSDESHRASKAAERERKREIFKQQ
eukprot:gene11408-7913_t